MDDVDRLWVGHAVGRTMAVDARAAFAALTDIGALATWNRSISEVLGAPESVRAGAQWTVQIRSGARRWRSTSVVSLHDPTSRRFAYRSSVDGGDGSYADWRWHVEDEPDGCTVRAGWVLRSASGTRGLLRDPMRARRLRDELPASLAQLEAVARCGVASGVGAVP